MFSQFILGCIIPSYLLFNLFKDKFYTGLELTKTGIELYSTILLETYLSSYPNILYTFLSPVTAFYKCLQIGFNSVHSYYKYNHNENISISENGYFVKYILQGEQYIIFIPKNKNFFKSIHLIEAIGYSQTETQVEEAETQVEEAETETEQTEETEAETEQTEAKQTEAKQTEAEEETEEVEQTLSEEEDILDLILQLMGPGENWHHNNKCTPKDLGYTRIKLRYLNDIFDECEKYVTENEVITF